MILIWFNPNDQKFYTRYYSDGIFFNYFVGYENSYGHIVIKIFILYENTVLDVYDVNHSFMLKNKKNKKKNNLLVTFLKMLLNKLQV